MARKKTVAAKPRQQELADGEWTEKPPKAVQDAVDRYVEALRAKAEAQGEVNTRKQAAIEAMQKAGIKKVKIDEGQKFLLLTETAGLKIQKPESDEPTGKEDDEDE